MNIIIVICHGIQNLHHNMAIAKLLAQNANPCITNTVANARKQNHLNPVTRCVHFPCPTDGDRS